MSRLTAADYDNVLDTIEAIGSLGLTGCGVTCGFPCEDIIAALRRTSPTNTMSDAEICDLLRRGTNSGTFRRHNVSLDCVEPLDEEDAFCSNDVTSNPEIVSLFSINQQMVLVNATNKQYADYFNTRAAARFVPLAGQSSACGDGITCFTDGLFEGSSSSVCANFTSGSWN